MLENKVNEENFNFLNESYLSILQNFGVQQMNSKNLNRITKSINRRYDIYNKLSLKEDRFIVRVKWAYFTMPHGFLWKFFHQRTWYHLKEMLKDFDKNATEEPVGVVDELPTVQKHVDFDALSYTSNLSLRE